MEGPSAPPSIADSEDEDLVLANSEFLTREEVLKRRSRRLRRLAKCYRDHYWSLMEDLRRKHREYYWKYGKSPFREENDSEKRENGTVAESVNNNSSYNHHNNDNVGSSKLGLGLEFGSSFSPCAFPGCRSKAMALSRYCHPHILSDTKQKLYKGCKYVLKSTLARPILCGKPILKSTVPSLCPSHLQKAEKHISRALKKGGLPVASSTKLASKFHLAITEYVGLIQTRRRAAVNGNIDNITSNDSAT